MFHWTLPDRGADVPSRQAIAASLGGASMINGSLRHSNRQTLHTCNMTKGLYKKLNPNLNVLKVLK
jgi:hypothetical protein